MEQQHTGPGPQAGTPGETGAHGSARQAAGPVAQPPDGDPRVDDALGRLDELAGMPVTEHPAVFEQVHRRLAEALGELGPDSAGR